MREGQPALGKDPAVIAVTKLLLKPLGGIPAQPETVSLT